MSAQRPPAGAPRSAAGPRFASPGEPPVDGIVLAAGRSNRMGAPKPLLDAGGETFVEHAIAVLRDGGCRDVVVVARAHLPEVERRARSAGARVVVNPDPEAQQLDSLRVGLGALRPGAAAALVLPVDLPRVSAATVRALLEGWRAGGAAAPVVRPVHRGLPGHPTLFARTLFGELVAGKLPQGARSVIARHEGSVLDVPVAEEGVLIDVNTPEEYLRRVRP